EAADDVDAWSVLAAGDRIDDWLAAPLRHARHGQTRLSVFDVYLEFDRQEHRWMQLVERCGEYLEDRRARFGVLTGHDAQQRLALLRRRALVDDDRGLAFALVDRTRPAEHADETQTVQLRVAMEALINLKTAYRLAKSVRRQGVELARTAVRAIAIDEFVSFNCPLHVAHRRLQ